MEGEKNNSNSESDIFGEEQIVRTYVMDEISPKDKLHFAEMILLGLAVIFGISVVTSGIAGYFNKECGKEILEVCKISLPPIATLIIGSYFGRPNK